MSAGKRIENRDRPRFFSAAPLTRGGSERGLRAGGWFLKTQIHPPRSPSAHAPLVRGAACQPEKRGLSLFSIRQRGFTYLAVLITVATLGGALGAAATVHSQQAQREKEAELLFVGDQYRQAIASYYERTPGGAKRYPQKLEDLLEDRRSPVPQRHLRRLYPDPMTGKEMAPLEAPMGGIMGVSSPSEAAPIKTGNFRPRDKSLAADGITKYSEWKFAYSPEPLAKPGPDGLPASQTSNNQK